MPTSVRLEPEIEARLDALAARTGRTKAFYLRQMIEDGIDDLEDYYRAAEISERIRRGEETTRPWADVRRDLGLDD
ncbi:MAG: type II toxin-antitoxin system RelB family antitoxin [Aliihoeflea sp.]|uniref:type II toxin-antitoxin system RelB family antitoxin n=1 Tax=unclassified Aliihoeflea TaxID=2628764 RepID=UPI000464D533|nr:ribbon-helix-helix protein, CopG family [Aliihoeflea sp. 2WW]